MDMDGKTWHYEVSAGGGPAADPDREDDRQVLRRRLGLDPLHLHHRRSGAVCAALRPHRQVNQTQNVLAFPLEGEYFLCYPTGKGDRTWKIGSAVCLGWPVGWRCFFVRHGDHEPGFAASSGGAAAGLPAPGHPHAPDRGAGGAGCHQHFTEQLGHHRNGHRLRQRRADGAATGGGRGVRGQCGHHHDGAAGGLPAGGLGVPPCCSSGCWSGRWPGGSRPGRWG